MANWKEVPEYEGLYEVSDTGEVRSMLRKQTWPNPRNKDVVQVKIIGGHNLKRNIGRRGYCRVALCKSGKRKDHLVHRLVLSAFKGNSELDVNHIDGNKENNALENLEYVTKSQNEQHAARVLKLNVGEQCYKSKLTEAQVLAIRAKHAAGFYRGMWADLSREYGAHPATIRDAATGRTWRHI